MDSDTRYLRRLRVICRALRDAKKALQNPTGAFYSESDADSIHDATRIAVGRIRDYLDGLP